MFCIGCNGHVPDEYHPDVNKKNLFYPDLTIPMRISPAKLQNSGFSTFREIYRKPLHIISKLTVVVARKYICTGLLVGPIKGGFPTPDTGLFLHPTLT